MLFREEELAAATTTATIDKLHGEAGHLSSLCQADLLIGSQAEARQWRLDVSFGDWRLDLSRQRLQPETLEHLAEWAEACGLAEQRQALFAAGIVNPSEGRPALHTALRWPQETPPVAGSEAEVTFAAEQRRRMAGLVERLRAGQWRGVTGQPIRHVIHIGVGGSDLGPRLVAEALEETHPTRGPSVHYVSTMDASQLVVLFERLDPAATLLVMASKSFTTADTRYNLETALTWLSSALGASREAICRQQLIGVSARPEKMAAMGIPEAHRLTFAEGVGGRFSLWSTIGISLAVQIGMPAFDELLAGAHTMDRHFLEAPTVRNLPVLMAVVGAWNSQFLGIPSHAVLPYDGRLASLPGYLQQLEMESNGKSVGRDGQSVEHATCPILWGDVGPNGQHAFYQLLHQGSHTVSADFIAVARRHAQAPEALQKTLNAQQRLTLANCLAQAQLMALGDDAIPVSLQAHMARGYRGNQPCSVLVMEELTPWNLGALLAMYEHKVFVQSLLWGLNPFDQPGVELGKRLAQGLEQSLATGDAAGDWVDDAATRAMVEHLLKHS